VQVIEGQVSEMTLEEAFAFNPEELDPGYRLAL
jgi:hypothetical protein